MFSHSIFSFSFTVLAALTAFAGKPDWRQGLLIVVAFLGGRTCANALNRVIDRKIDARNPRTAVRHLPAGLVSAGEALAVAAVSFAALAAAAFFLNPLCAALLPVAGALFVFYSFTKRFTWLCHAVLGVVCAGASVGAWIAVRGRIEWPVLILAASNAAWVAGFDIVYAVQDIEFDRSEGLKSIPARFGSRGALLIAGAAHTSAVLALVLFGFSVGLGFPYFITVSVIAALLFWAWTLAWKDYRKNTLFASYSANQVVSLALLAGTAAEFFVFGTEPVWMSLAGLIGKAKGAFL